jgi:hypothetical protein
MTAVKKSIGPLGSPYRTYTETPNSVGKLLALVLLCSLLAGPALASPAGRPPNSVITAVRQDISQRTRIPADRLKIESASERTWTDGCLGLARPEEICTQSLVNGWQITVTDDRKTWLYRTDSTGRSIRLER